MLVVDDDAVNRDILFLQLQTWKTEVAIAQNGQEALTVLQAAVQAGRPFALALLDVQMPVTDGWMLAQSIKTDQALRGTRLIMLTSVGQTLGPAELQARLATARQTLRRRSRAPTGKSKTSDADQQAVSATQRGGGAR